MVAHRDARVALVRELFDGRCLRVHVEYSICPRWLPPIRWVVVRGLISSLLEYALDIVTELVCGESGSEPISSDHHSDVCHRWVSVRYIRKVFEVCLLEVFKCLAFPDSISQLQSRAQHQAIPYAVPGLTWSYFRNSAKFASAGPGHINSVRIDWLGRSIR